MNETYKDKNKELIKNVQDTCGSHEHSHHGHEHTEHGHEHSHHGHYHHHHHNVNVDSLNKAFVWGIILNALFVVAEFLIGFFADSVGLISDAGHNLSDVASLILAMLAFKVAKIHTNNKYTYGYKKMTVHVSLINAVILLVAVAFIIIESINKLFSPSEVQGKMIIFTAAAGVLINGVTAWLFIKDKDKDLNVKGAYLHMFADAIVSVGVVISGIVIMVTEMYWIDGVIGLVVAVIIIISTVDLLKDSVRLALDGVPQGIDYNEIAEGVKQIENVSDVHHIHIWAISTTENSLTAHIKIKDIDSLEKTKHDIKHYLKNHNIVHSTLEFEASNCQCGEKDCCC